MSWHQKVTDVPGNVEPFGLEVAGWAGRPEHWEVVSGYEKPIRESLKGWPGLN